MVPKDLALTHNLQYVGKIRPEFFEGPPPKN